MRAVPISLFLKLLGLAIVGSAAILAGIMRLDSVGYSMRTGILPEDLIDIRYSLHPYISALHVVPGIIFLVIGPLQIIPAIRKRAPWLHRWFGRIFIVTGAIAALSAIVMCLVFPAYGGIWTTLASVTFGITMLVALRKGYVAIKSRDVMRHRAWMLRAMGIGMSVSSIRLFFVLQDVVFGNGLDASFAMSFWMGFIVNMTVVEIILLMTRPRRKTVSA